MMARRGMHNARLEGDDPKLCPICGAAGGACRPESGPGLTITKETDTMVYTLDRRLWLTRDKSRVVEDGDPEAAWLLGAPGAVISDAEAKRYGLIEAKAQEAPERAKAPSGPARKKSR